MPKRRVKNTTRRNNIQWSCFLKSAATLVSSTGFAMSFFSMSDMPLVDLLI